MDRAARAVTTRLRKVQRFHHNALAGEGRVTVHLHSQHLRAVLVVAALLARLDRPFHDRVDDFQVRRVERQRQVDGAARGGHVAREALVVLHVTGRQVVHVLAFEFGKQVGRHLAQRVDQHVQTAAVGHADHDFLDALGAGMLDQFVHRRDKALAAFQREALLTDVLRMQETLEAFSGRQAFQDVLLLFSRERRLGADGFQTLLPPALLRLVADVHELGADRTAVRFAQIVDQLAQAHRLLAEIRIAGVENDVLVGFGETVESRVQIRNRRALLTLERVKIGPTQAHIAVGSHQLRRRHALATHIGIGRRDNRADRAMLGALCERCDDGGVGDIPGVGTVDGGDVLQRIEVRAQCLANGRGILKVRFVLIFNVGGVTAGQVRSVQVLLIQLCHGALTFLRVCRSSAGSSTFRDTA